MTTVPQIFDYRRLALRPRRQADAFLTQQLWLRLADRVAVLTVAPARVAVLGGAIPDGLRDLLPQAEIFHASFDAQDRLQTEPMPNLVLDLGALALINDLPGALIQIRQALASNGVFLSAIYGGSSLLDLRQALLTAETELTGGAAPRLHPLLTLEDGIALLQRAGFALPVADLEPLRVTYGDMPSLARDLRAAGLSNALTAAPRQTPPRRLFTRTFALWQQAAPALAPAPTGRALAHFDIVTLTGWQA